MSIEFKSNKAQVNAQMNRNITRCLTMMGLHGQRRVAENTPVDSGRLRNSINSQVAERHVDVGTNVEYAIHVHFPGITRNWEGNPFIDKGILHHAPEYKEIAERTLREGF